MSSCGVIFIWAEVDVDVDVDVYVDVYVEVEEEMSSSAVLSVLKLIVSSFETDKEGMSRVLWNGQFFISVFISVMSCFVRSYGTLVLLLYSSAICGRLKSRNESIYVFCVFYTILLILVV